MHDAVVSFVQSVRIESCRVVNTPNLIFLCGGVISSAGLILSARDYFQRYIKKNHPEIHTRIKLAETISEWFKHDTFSDLLELEEYLADVSDLIVLFVESAGSIAELGAFAASDTLRPKTLAVLNGSHPLERTFIADGPVRRLQGSSSDSVHYYDWDADNLNDEATLEVFADLGLELSQLLVDRRAKTPNEIILTDSHGHLMLLGADLVDIIGIVTREDVSDCLRRWGFDCPPQRLAKCLSLLKDLQILKAHHYSSQQYYVSMARTPFIRYDFLPDAPARDRMRIRSIVRAAMDAHDSRRAKAFRSHLRKMTRGGQHG